MSKEILVEYGKHTPFDSDSCLEWAVFCHNNNHDPDTPVFFNEEKRESILLQDIKLCIGLKQRCKQKT